MMLEAYKGVSSSCKMTDLDGLHNCGIRIGRGCCGKKARERGEEMFRFEGPEARGLSITTSRRFLLTTLDLQNNINFPS